MLYDGCILDVTALMMGSIPGRCDGRYSYSSFEVVLLVLLDTYTYKLTR
jgi:hypothetical protein